MAEKEKLAGYQLKCVGQVWFNQWKEDKMVTLSLLE